MVMARAGVYVSIGETHWEVGCRCRLWGRSRRCAYGSGSGRNAACLWALVSARRSSSSVMNDRNKRLPFHPPQGNKTPLCLGRNSLPFQTSTIWEKMTEWTSRTGKMNIYPPPLHSPVCVGAWRCSQAWLSEPQALTQLLGRVAVPVQRHQSLRHAG